MCENKKKSFFLKNLQKIIKRVKFKTFAQLMCVKGQKKKCLCMWEDGNTR